MDEIQRAFEEYLQSLGRDTGFEVHVKDVGNVLAPRFIADRQPLSEVIAEIRRLFRQYSHRGLLMRIRPGVYLYKASGWSTSEIASAEHYAPPRAAGEFAFRARPIEPYQPQDFSSVATLAASSAFLVTRNLEGVNLEVLDGLSF